MFANTLP